MNERNTTHSRLPFAMHESEASPQVYSSQTPAARAGDAGHESRHILVHTGDPMSGLFAALRPRGLSAGLISLAAGTALLYYGRLFLVTVCTAVIINFILEPFVGLLTRVRVPRALASFIVCSFAVCAVYFAGLGVYRQGATLVEDVPKYAERIGDLSDGVLTKLENMEQAVHAMVAPRRLSQPRTRRQRKGGARPSRSCRYLPHPEFRRCAFNLRFRHSSSSSTRTSPRYTKR